MTKKEKKMSNVTIRLSEEEKEKLNNYAKNNNISRGQVLRDLFTKEIKNKTLKRYTEKLNPPLALYIPLNTYFHTKRILDSSPNLLSFEKVSNSQSNCFIFLLIEKFTNNLDIWKDNEFKSADYLYEHEGLIIHRETYKPYDYIYLIYIKKTKYTSFATLLNLDGALIHSKLANNEKLYNELMEIKNNPKEKELLFETKIKEQLKKFNSMQTAPRNILPCHEFGA